MRDDWDNLWLVYRYPSTGREIKLLALEWIGQLGPVDEDGEDLELIGWEAEQ